VAGGLASSRPGTQPGELNAYRRSIRLRGYDYSQAGAYFITICTALRECVLGEICEGQMHLSAAVIAVERVWWELPTRFPAVGLDSFIIMPNHVHGIIVIQDMDGNAQGSEPLRAAVRRMPLGRVVRAFKSLSGIEANRCLGRSERPFWQRNYYEHVIRDDTSLTAIRQYIADNPARWPEDPENPARTHH
jgi:putative transposase